MMRANMDKYMKMLLAQKNSKLRPYKGVQKRKGAKFPMATIHSKIVILCNEDFCIYEQYGTWYLSELKNDK